MKLGLLHITIGMLRLSSDEGIAEAMALVEDLQETLSDFLRQHDVRLRLEGLDTFGQRVLFAKVVPETDTAFWEFIAIIKNRIALTSANVMVTNKFEFTPHLTIVKVSRPVARVRNSKYLPSALYEKFADHKFGQQKLDNLNLCVIESSTRHDGFYRTLKEITFD
jgi:2'-5' RNA ligase